MSDAPSAIVVGASSGVGRALAGVLAEAGYNLIISARSEADLSAVASGLQLRYSVSVTPIRIDLRGTDEQLNAYWHACTERLSHIDAVLFAAGAVDDADDGTSSWELSNELVTANFLAIMKLAGQFITQFEREGRGTLVLFSSIAAAAPRSRNVAYAAAKRALESYGRSMQHRLSHTEVRVQVYRLGYVDTAMTKGRKLLLPAVAPTKVAQMVLRNLSDGHRLAYFPQYWSVVAFVLRCLPWSVYKRLSF